MTEISRITRNEIFDLFIKGFEEDSWIGTTHHQYNYYGRLSEIDFLKKLYPLEMMQSEDARYQNAYEVCMHIYGKSERKK